MKLSPKGCQKIIDAVVISTRVDENGEDYFNVGLDEQDIEMDQDDFDDCVVLSTNTAERLVDLMQTVFAKMPDKSVEDITNFAQELYELQRHLNDACAKFKLPPLSQIAENIDSKRWCVNVVDDDMITCDTLPLSLPLGGAVVLQLTCTINRMRDHYNIDCFGGPTSGKSDVNDKNCVNCTFTTKNAAKLIHFFSEENLKSIAYLFNN